MRLNVVLIGLIIALTAGCSGSSQKPAASESGATIEQKAAVPKYPYDVAVDGAMVTLYQPQVTDWKDHETLTAWIAVGVLPAGADKHVMGAIEGTAKTTVDANNRTVLVYDKQVLSATFPGVDQSALPALQNQLRAAVQTGSSLIPLDTLLANIQHNKVPSRVSTGINMAPPRIFFSDAPAVLVIINGKPMLADTSKDSGLQIVINTNWQLFQVPGDKTWYLLNDKQWLRASQLTGPWRETTDLPAAFSSLPDTPTWKSAREAIPASSSNQPVPHVFVSEKPAELIYVDGKPELEEIPGTGLAYVENTESNVFMQDATGIWYFLVSGRWFSAQQISGPWETVTHMPAGFTKIPPGSEKADVLSSVPGTVEARLAVLEAQIPQTATVMFTTRPPDIQYSGDPIFKPIEGTSLEFAVNTQSAVIKDHSAYFYVYDGVWFTAGSPHGPWGVATSIPKEIYSIPPESPLYYVTFVTIESANSDSVTTAYTSGYNQTYVAPATTSSSSNVSVTVVYGTGYWYNPWVYYNPYMWYRYPVYWSYPYTYGWNAGYNSTTGRYYRSGHVYGPYGGAGYGYQYNPTTGAFAQGRYAYGPYGGAGAAHGFNPVTDTGFATRQYGNGYQSWGNSVVSHNDNWANVTRHTVDGQSTFNIRTSEGGQGRVVSGDQGTSGIYKTGDGDVYASHDGNVYKKDDDGFQQYDNSSGNWNDMNLSQENQQKVDQARSQGLDSNNLNDVDRTNMSGADAQFSQYHQLNRDAASRQYGNQRYNSFQRGSFGGNRGGGRRR